MEDKKIVVLGGGTAGWITALFARKTFPSASITLIENTSLGIVGVGEGTTLAFAAFLHNELDIDGLEILKECRGSIKTGISFENWNGDNKKYFHSFPGINGQLFAVPPHYYANCEKYHLQTLIKEGLDFNEYSYAARLAYRNEVDFHHMPVALHIDTHKLGTYLRGLGKQRNIVSIDGNFSHVQVDENDFIKTLCLDGGVDVDCDFVFDCSGFAKLLIGKYYKVSWESYENFLPMKQAIAFSLESEKEVTPYTQAIAMKYGWVWKIPLQDRIGAGYVFDSDYLSADEALDEVQQTLNLTIPNVLSIPFDAGHHKEFWVKNCISVGLASNFIEPLEATSMDTISSQLLHVKEYLNHFFTYNKTSVAMYNDRITSIVDGISNFIYLHYLTKRSDTEFWKTFKQRHPPPQKFEGLLELLYENNVRDYDIAGTHFTHVDYIEVAHGVELFRQPMDMSGYENLIPSVETYKKWVDTNILDPTSVIPYTDFLARLDSVEPSQSPFRYFSFCECVYRQYGSGISLQTRAGSPGNEGIE